MAGFTNQIKARFKAKFPKVNLSAEKLDAIIARVDAKTEADDEEAIDASLDAINEYTPFEEMAKDEDKLRDLQAKVGKKSPKKVEVKAEDVEPEDEPENPVLAMLKELKGEIATLKSEKTTTSRKTQLETLLKDASESYRNKALKDFGRMQFDSDEAFNDFLADAKTDVESHVQDLSNSGLGKDKPGGAGAGGGGKVKEASKEEVDAVMSHIKI